MRKPYDEPMANMPPVKHFCRVPASHSINIGTGTRRTITSIVTLKRPFASNLGIGEQWPGIVTFHILATGSHCVEKANQDVIM